MALRLIIENVQILEHFTLSPSSMLAGLGGNAAARGPKRARAPRSVRRFLNFLNAIQHPHRLQARLALFFHPLNRNATTAAPLSLTH